VARGDKGEILASIWLIRLGWWCDGGSAQPDRRCSTSDGALPFGDCASGGRSGWATGSNCQSVRAGGTHPSVCSEGPLRSRKPLIDARNFDTIDITQPGGGWFDFNWLALNHDVYASSPVLVADMEGIIERHQHPPGLRTKELEPVALQEGTYWLFRSPQTAIDGVPVSLSRPSSPTQPNLATPPLAVIAPNSTEPPMPLVVAAPPAIASPPSETSTLRPQAEPKTETNQAKLP
jgi:hypothetical protein